MTKPYFASDSSFEMRSGENVPWPSRWRTCLKMPSQRDLSEVTTVILPFIRPNAAASSLRMRFVSALAATLPDGRVIAGTVDRLLVEESQVSVLDFKTGRVPDGEASIPKTHRAQMEAYAEALRVIFAGRSVRAALLYTAGPILFELAP